MRRKLKLLGRAARSGWTWGTAYTDHAGRVFTMVTVLLGTGTVSALSVGWWGPVAAVTLLGLLALAVGALNEWDRAEKRIEADEYFQRSIAGFQQRCYKHAEDVGRFLDVREAGGPPPPRNLASARRGIGSAENERRREAAEQYERETVAAFLASEHLDRGIGLFDFLIEWEFIVDTNRPRVAQPHSIADITTGIDSITTAAERLPVYR